MQRSRRQVLNLFGVGCLTALAGCSDSSSSSDDGDPTSSNAGGSTTRTATPTTTLSTSTLTTTRDESTSTENAQARFAARDGDKSDVFGDAVSVSSDGTTAIVGAPNDEDPNGRGAGSAYVFTEGDEWSQDAKLAPDDGDDRDYFGDSVAVSNDGTTTIVGAPSDDPNGSDSGSAYVFTSGEGWSQEAKLVADDGAADDHFGCSVAMSGDGRTAVVGAHYDAGPDGYAEGSAYVFTSGEGWAQQSKLEPEDTGGGNTYFGGSVAASRDGTTVVVGADHDNNASGYLSGAAYVFSSDGGWGQQAKLRANDAEPVIFGHTVAVSGDGTTVLVSDPKDLNANGKHGGRVYVFSASGGWSQQTTIAAADGDSFDYFGEALAVSGDGSTAVVGAPDDEDPNGEKAGSAYVFGEDDEWRQRTKLVAGDGDAEDRFGAAVTVSGEGASAIVGAPDGESGDGKETGSAYVFE